MTHEIQSAQSALELAIAMVPHGQFGEEETDRRRGLWQLWVMLPALLRAQPVYPEILAKTFNEPLEWVNEVLSLNTESALV